MELNRQGIQLVQQDRLEQALDPLREAVGIAPEYYPAANNLAQVLFHLGKLDEAEPLLRELVRDHPAYLYAHATLLKLYRQQDRIAEARELVKVTDMPDETQPDAMAAWHIELSNMYKQTGDDEKARRHIKFARDICPEMLD